MATHKAAITRWMPWILVFLVVGATFLGPAWAKEDEQTKLLRSRRSKLRSAAGKWITHRTRFPSRCPLCQGSGKILSRKGRRIIRIECHQCDGQGVWISKKDYRIAYWDMRSPTFRASSAMQDAVTAQYVTASAGRPWPTKIDRYRIRRWELIDETHGIAWFRYNASKAPTATYWLWVPKDARRGTWHLYDARMDGPWPEAVEEDSPVTPPAVQTWEPVEPSEGQALRGAADAAQMTFRAAEFLKRGSTVRIRLLPRSDAGAGSPASRIGSDAVRLMRAAFRGSKAWSRFETEWNVRWQAASGLVRMKPLWVASLSRSAYEAAPWEELDGAEQVGLLDWEAAEDEGWTPLPDEGAEPPPAPTPKPTPEPEPTPVRPQPAPPGPPPAARRALPQAPAAPVPPPSSRELPPLKKGARRDAQKGLARIRGLFQQAVAAYNEGHAAHRNGAHDVWQEKLSESRTHLAEIEEAWLEDVVAEMPGRDEAEQEAVANEHFGEIWDEIYKLKSMVRKMSALR